MPPVPVRRTALADSIRRASHNLLLREALFLALFAVMYTASYVYGNRLPSPAPIWLPDAVLLSALLLTARRRWAGIILIVVVIRLLPPLAPSVPYSLLALFLLGDLLKAFIAVLLLRRFGGYVLHFDSMRAVGVYIACAVIAAPAMSACIGAAGRLTLGGDYWSAWIVWFLGDALACLLIAPALLVWLPRLRVPSRDSLVALPSRRITIEAIAVAVALLLVGFIVFIGSSTAGLHPVSQLYLITPLLLWTAVRFGSVGISAALACIALLATTGAAMGRGPFVMGATSTDIIALQIFLAVTAVPLLLLAAAIAERARSEQEMEALATRLLQAQDEERRRIARELHDSTLQTVTAAKLDLHRLRIRLKNAEYDEGAYAHLLDESETLTDQVIADLRTLSYLLHPPMLEELGLAAALQWYVEGFAARSNLHMEVQTPADLGRLPRRVEMALYRVAQEGLANVYRHSRSSSVRITLDMRGSTISLRIQDWGQGMVAGMAGGAGEDVGARTVAGSVSEASRANEESMRRPLLGVGITGMRRRLQQLGGRLEITSTAQGTTILAIVPLDAKSWNGLPSDEGHDGGIGDALGTPKDSAPL
ncbi:MAG TPA: MASE1 domain-containing protein [Ktedonobacterales bacterium]|nr:MASE1 domain-containing protein [Ktedonobacterales bacterium]